MLEKGTITKKGKLRMGNRRKKLDPSLDALARSTEQKKAEKEKEQYEAKRSKDDFTSKENLGELDLQSFLQSVVADGQENGSIDDFQLQESSDSENDLNDVDVEGKKNDDDDDDDEDPWDDSDDDDDDVDDDDDEDIEAAEKRMKDEMAKLAETDPEFHDYLQKNEASLLEFQNETSDVDQDELDGVNSDTDAKNHDQDNNVEESTESNVVLVDAKLLKKLEHGAFESHGIRPLRKLVAAYVSACHMADTQHQDEDGTGRYRVQKTKRYVIESSTVFDKLLVTCLSKVHEEFHYHLLGMGSKAGNDDDGDDDDEEENMNKHVDESQGVDTVDPDKPINPQKLARAPRWLSLSMSIKSFMKATLHLLSEAKEAKLLNFIIKALANYLPFVSAFPRLGNALLKSLTAMWASSSDSSKPYQAVRVNAFLRIRQLAITQPFPFIEQCLKATYLAYAKTAKFANASTVSSLLPQLTFMGNCVVELYSLDYASSYQHAFVYIRQLALHLRSALQKKTPEAFRVVYCWQYMHCLKLWTAVLAATCGKVGDGDEESALMRSLIYPLVEVIFGTASLIPSTRHLPLRLHCVRFLQQLAAASETFIPTTSILLEVFDLKEVAMTPKRAKKGTGDIRGVRLPIILKLPKDDPLRTAEQLDACLGETFLLMNREVDLYKFSAGIPEFTVRITQRLRKVRVSFESTLRLSIVFLLFVSLKLLSSSFMIFLTLFIVCKTNKEW